MATEDKVSVPPEKKIGMPKRESQWPSTPAKWIELLGTPLTILIAVSGLLWGVYQFNSQQQSDSQKAVQQQQLTRQQEVAAQQQALDQQRQTILDTYLDRMSEMLLVYRLAAPQSSEEVRALAQARTFTAVRNLDGTRKGTLIRFLWEAKLINGPQPIISLAAIDLHDAIFVNSDLSGANLYGADLSGADLLLTYLFGANFYGANLSEAYVSIGMSIPYPARSSGNQTYAIQPYAIHPDPNPSDLSDAVNGADLYSAHLYPSGFAGASLRGAPLEGVYLNSVDLSGANLSSADLSGANLSGANLSGTDLSKANLRGAIVTSEQLAKAKSLKGTTMPNGTIHP